jgi:hypothetical protein
MHVRGVFVVVVLTILLDGALLLLGFARYGDANILDISRAYREQMERPSPEATSRLQAALDKGTAIAQKAMIPFYVSMLVVTVAGGFIVVRMRSRQRRVMAPLSI